MQIGYLHNRRRGGLFRTLFFEVHVYCQFTPEELAIIHKTNIYDFVIAKRTPHPHSLKWKKPEKVKALIAEAALTVRDVINHHPESFAFKDFVAAKAYERDAREGFRKLAEIIDTNIDPDMYVEEEL